MSNQRSFWQVVHVLCELLHFNMDGWQLWKSGCVKDTYCACICASWYIGQHTPQLLVSFSHCVKSQLNIAVCNIEISHPITLSLQKIYKAVDTLTEDMLVFKNLREIFFSTTAKFHLTSWRFSFQSVFILCIIMKILTSITMW